MSLKNLADRILSKRSMLLLAGVALIAMAVILLVGHKSASSNEPGLTIQSNIEMTETNINSQIAGKIKEIKIMEGETVSPGQVLILIDSETLNAQHTQATGLVSTILGQLESAQAAQQIAAAQLDKARNGARPEELAQIKSTYELAQATYDRTKVLYDSGAVSKAQLEADATKLEQAKSAYNIAVNGARPEDISIYQAQVAQAESSIRALEGQLETANGKVQEIQTYIKNATITAPSKGVVTLLNVEVGELVSTGMPLVVITDINHPWIKCNVKETDLHKVRLNQKVSIKIPAYPGQEFAGQVYEINKNADFAVKRATNDNGDFDVLSYGVKVKLLDMNQSLKAGMTVFVNFLQ